MEIILLGAAVVILAVAVICSLAANKPKDDVSSDHFVGYGQDQGILDERKAQRARTDAIAAHDAIFRSGPPDRTERS